MQRKLLRPMHLIVAGAQEAHLQRATGEPRLYYHRKEPIHLTIRSILRRDLAAFWAPGDSLSRIRCENALGVTLPSQPAESKRTSATFVEDPTDLDHSVTCATGLLEGT